MTFEESWRWYGPNDPISLLEIKQTGAGGVVTSLHQIPVGEVWHQAQIKERLDLIEQSNQNHPHELRWNVVESLPVHEEIKLGGPRRDSLIENYKMSMKNLAKSGVKTICYNFMPVVDWLRTDLNYQLPDGSRTLWYDEIDVALFDLFILKRMGSSQDYPDSIRLKAADRFESYDKNRLVQLEKTLLLALPGESDHFTLEKLRDGIQNYKNIGADQLRDNLVYFLKAVIPLAEELNIKMAIHPDDPPWPVLGLPRIVSTRQDLHFLFESVPSQANGFTFCSGSLGAGKENDLPQIIENYYERIHFIHLRSIQRLNDEVFHEADHLEGNADIYTLVKLFSEKQLSSNRNPIPMRPDHGHLLAREKEQQFYPGYSYLGRLKGLAEIRGLERGIRKSI